MRPSTLTAIQALESTLDRTSARGSVLAHNLANVNTPGYKRMDLSFGDTLATALAGAGGGRLRLATTHPQHLRPSLSGNSGPRLVRGTGTTLRNDGNNVDIEAEMAVLSENAYYYQALVQEMNNRLGILRLAINEGRR